MHASPHIPLQYFARCGMHVSRGTVTRGACDLTLLGYCLFARSNAVSARTQSFVTTAETAIERECLPARRARPSEEEDGVSQGNKSTGSQDHNKLSGKV